MTLEHLVIRTLPSGLEIAAVIFVLLGTSSLPLFRYWETLKESSNISCLSKVSSKPTLGELNKRRNKKKKKMTRKPCSNNNSYFAYNEAVFRFMHNYYIYNVFSKTSCTKPNILIHFSKKWARIILKSTIWNQKYDWVVRT